MPNYIINKEIELWTLNFLVMLLNDVNCEVVMIVILVLEEFITPESAHLLNTSVLD